MMLPSKWMTLRMKAENGLWMARGQPCCCLQHHCYSCNAKEKTRVLQKTEDEVWFMMSGSNTATFTANFVFETCEQKKTQQYCTVLYKYDVFFRCLCNNSSCWHLIGHTFRRTRINKHPYVLENNAPISETIEYHFPMGSGLFPKSQIQIGAGASEAAALCTVQLAPGNVRTSGGSAWELKNKNIA